MAPRDALHDQLEALNLWPAQEFPCHALVSAGLVTRLECAWPDCEEESRTFVPRIEGQAPASSELTIDHIIATNNFGLNRIENLQLMHFRCNSVKGAREVRQHQCDVCSKSCCAGGMVVHLQHSGHETCTPPLDIRPGEDHGLSHQAKRYMRNATSVEKSLMRKTRQAIRERDRARKKVQDLQQALKEKASCLRSQREELCLMKLHEVERSDHRKALQVVVAAEREAYREDRNQDIVRFLRDGEATAEEVLRALGNQRHSRPFADGTVHRVDAELRNLLAEGRVAKRNKGTPGKLWRAT